MTIQIEKTKTLKALAEQTRGQVFLPDDPGYDKARTGWNLSVQQHPALVLMAETPEDIVQAVRYADRAGMWVAVQATGHGTLRPANDACFGFRTALTVWHRSSLTRKIGSCFSFPALSCQTHKLPKWSCPELLHIFATYLRTKTSTES